MIRRIVLIVACLMVVGFEWAIVDADTAEVRRLWAERVPRVSLAVGVRGTLNDDSAWWGAYSLFTPGELTALRSAFDSLGVAHDDSASGFVPAQTEIE
jgi:hypothetical protein